PPPGASPPASASLSSTCGPRSLPTSSPQWRTCSTWGPAARPMRPRDGLPLGDSSPTTIAEAPLSFADPWPRLRRDTLRLSDGRTLSPGPVLEYPDWVDVVALTDELNIVL